tara:strand:+ start:391 stop:537 length:147 start_codon:yes stop_codon:yes gene_type:complete
MSNEIERKLDLLLKIHQLDVDRPKPKALKNQTFNPLQKHILKQLLRNG